MSEKNKALLRSFYEEVVNAGDLDRIEEFCTPDFVDHEEVPDTPGGIEGVRVFFKMIREAFPDLQFRVEDILAENDLVAARVTMRGTHQGEFMGAPPSGKSIEASAIDIVRITDGKASEHWGITDMMALMQQIGAIPEQQPA